MVEVDFSGGWHIARGSQEPAVALAAAELDATLASVAGPRPDRRLAIELVHRGEEGDGFVWRAAREAILIEGAGPRGTLYGAYSVLEALGCRWPWPGQERVPHASRVRLPSEPVADEPALAGRCLVLGERAFLERVDEWVVWAARNRLNDLFVHVSTRRDPVGAAPEGLWLTRRERAVPVCRERGIAIEHGGHLLPELVSSDVLSRVPGELRDERAGEATAALRRAVSRHLHAHPEAQAFHLWGADAPVGGTGAAVSEQALRITNAVAGGVEEAAPSATLAFLAYHDTEEVPRAVVPARNVFLLWAPRERCYRHGIGDPRCRHNARFRELFHAQVAHFAGAGAQPPRVLEYYLDALRFGGEVPPLGPVMRDDLAFYRGGGAHTVQALMTGRGDWRAPHANPWLFARLAWNPAQDPDRLLADWREAASS